jgi:phage-related protein
MFPVLEGRFLHGAPAFAETARRQLESYAYSILDTPGQLRWRPSDSVSGKWRVADVQLYETLNTGDGLFKTFIIPLIAPDPFIHGETVYAQNSDFYDPGGGGGLSFPFSFPFSFAVGTGSGAQIFTNYGDNDTWPTIRIWGPIVNPTVRNHTLGLKVDLTDGLVVAAGDYVDVDMFLQEVTSSDGLSLSRYVNWTASDFFPLAPGPNTLGVVGSATNTTQTRLTVTWRDGYS